MGVVLAAAAAAAAALLGASGSSHHHYVKSDGDYNKHHHEPQRHRPVEWACPEGSIQASKYCVHIEYADFVNTCSKGSRELADGSCLVKKYVPSKLACPPTHLPVRGKCEHVERFPIETRCDDGYALRNGTCVKRVKSKASLSCPEGRYSLEGTLCTRVERHEAEASCPPHSIRKDDGYCEILEVVPAKLSCDDDFVREGNSCVKEEVTQRVLSCKKGYRLDGLECVRRSDVGPQAFECPEGATAANGRKKCEVLETRKPAPQCRKDFTLENGVCVRVLREQPHFVCEDGFKKVDDTACQKKSEVEGRYSCPPDSVPDGNRCIVMLSAPAEASCRTPGFDHVGNVCVRREKRKPTVSCRHGAVREGNRCTLATKVKMQYRCPDGAVLRKKQCETSEAIPADLVCKRGRLEDGGCVEEAARPLKSYCPHGFHVEEHECTMRSFVKPEVVCADDGILEGGKCQVFQRVKAPRGCPHGFVIGTSGRCQRAFTTDATPRCRENEFIHGKYCIENKSRDP